MLQLIVVPTFFSRVSDPPHETVTGKTVMEKTTRTLSVLSASLPTRQDVCHVVLSSVPGHHCRSWPAVCCIDFTAQLGVQLASPTSASLSETLITREKGYQLSFPVPTVSFHMYGVSDFQNRMEDLYSAYASRENSNAFPLVLICISTEPKL